MKPFDLEAAKAGKPIMMRNGNKVRFVVHVPEITGEDRVFVTHEYNGRTSIISYRENGKYLPGKGYDDMDLCMASEKKTGWIGVYGNINEPVERYVTGINICNSPEKARAVCPLADAIVKIEWEA